MGFESTLLFASPSAISGAARLLDIGGTFDDYNDFPTDEMADTAAIASDWRAVGQDINVAMEQMDKELGKTDVD